MVGKHSDGWQTFRWLGNIQMVGKHSDGYDCVYCVCSTMDSASVWKTAEVATAAGAETTTGATLEPAAYVSNTFSH